MPSVLSYKSHFQTLILRGVLNHKTLLLLWQQRVSLLENKVEIDVAQLHHIDSAGLALLVHLQCTCEPKTGVKLKLLGATDQLIILMTLYNLQTIMSVNID